jgi:hypothetical protein
LRTTYAVDITIIVEGIHTDTPAATATGNTAGYNTLFGFAERIAQALQRLDHCLDDAFCVKSNKNFKV